MDALRPLGLDQFAAMTAEIEAGFPRDRVLAAASVSVEQWELTQETWLLRMAKQGSQRKLALLDRYNELLAKHRKDAQRKMRAEKRRLRGPMPVAPELVLSALARTRADDEAGATFQKPGSGDGNERASIVAPLAPAAVPAMVPARAAAGIDAPSTVDDPASPASSAPPAVKAPAGPTWLKPKPAATLVGTLRLADGMPPVAGPAWLAAKGSPKAETAGPPAAPPSPSPSPPAPPPATPVEETQPAAPSPIARQRPGRGSTLVGTTDVFKSPAGPAWLSKAPQEQRDGAASRASGAEALPFKQRPAAPSQPPPPPDGLPFQRPGTLSQLPPLPAAAQGAQGPTAQGAGAGPRLTIEQLAWLQAQTETSPELGRAAREKLSLSEGDYARERAFWQGRFQQDRATLERYSQLFYHYRRAR